MIPALHFPDFSHRIEQPEIMDDHTSNEAELRTTLKHFSFVNRFFSRTHAVFARLAFPDIRNHGLRRLTVLDVGAGGGDFARWCVLFLKRRGVVPRIICLDNDRRAIDYLSDSCTAFPEIEILQGSLLQLDRVDGPIDYIVSTHVLHHFNNAQIPEILAIAYATARRGILINDLLRNPLMYFAFSLFAGAFFRGGFTLPDGLVSIRKGFTSKDMRGYIDAAGLTGHVGVRTSAIGHIALYGAKFYEQE